jgi:hypothetical protein
MLTTATRTSHQRERRKFTRRIGNTNYEVVVYLSDTSRETMNDKIMRMVKNESVSGKAAGK